MENEENKKELSLKEGDNDEKKFFCRGTCAFFDFHYDDKRISGQNRRIPLVFQEK